MRLIVAEKPSVARDIARVLGVKGKNEGYLSGDNDTVTWALGHLVGFVDPDQLDARYKSWRLDDLPILPQNLPLKVLPRTKKQFSIVKKLMNDKAVTEIVCATDAGREGELIFRLIYELAGCGKPVSRLWISSLTDSAITEGFKQLKPAADYEGLYRSARSRAPADWLVGMNGSRAFTTRYKALLSIGRVQTPTLALIVARSIQVRDFVPTDFHVLWADHGDFEAQWFDPKAEANVRHRIDTAERAKQIADKVKGKEARVIEAQSEDKRELPPLLFDLTSLQREANARFGFTAKKTLSIAQSLYEGKKCLSYPRTDSKHLPRDQYARIPGILSALPADYQALVDGIPRKNGKLPFTPRLFDDKKVTDHHAIIPTQQKAKNLSPDEEKIFDLVVRRLIAAFYPAFCYKAQRVVTQAEGEHFLATGREVTDAGWRAVIPQAKAAEEDKALTLPALGDSRTISKTTVKKQTTKPPALYTDATLLYAMETAGKELDDEELALAMKGSGLGTPATRAAIIERLIEVGYAKRKGRALIATEKGEKLIAIAPEQLSSSALTGRWEKALYDIAQGEQDVDRFITGIERMCQFLVDYVKNEAPAQEFEKEVRGKGGKVRAAQAVVKDVVCPLCGADVTENTKAFGCSRWKAGCAFTLWKNALSRVGGPALTKTLITRLFKDKTLAGSTGTLSLTPTGMTFTPKGKQEPVITVPYAHKRADK